MIKVQEMQPGAKALTYKKGFIYVACCDCKLVHLFAIKRKGEEFEVMGWRDEEATKELRKVRNARKKKRRRGY